MVGYDPWHWDEKDKPAGGEHWEMAEPPSDDSDYFNYMDGWCRDPHGRHDGDEKEEADDGTWGWFNRCPCVGCKKRRARILRERLAAEDAPQSAPQAAWSGTPFLLPTIRQRAWSFLKALAFGGACVAAVEIARAIAKGTSG